MDIRRRNVMCQLLTERSKEKVSRSLKRIEKSILWSVLGWMERSREKVFF